VGLLFGSSGGWDGGRSGGKVPDTIGKARGEKMRKAGAKKSWFDKKSVDQRKASEKQRGNWLWN
jgi:hypothetical protein